MSNKPWHEAVDEKMNEVAEGSSDHFLFFDVTDAGITIDGSLSAEKFHELCRVTLRALGEID